MAQPAAKRASDNAAGGSEGASKPSRIAGESLYLSEKNRVDWVHFDTRLFFSQIPPFAKCSTWNIPPVCSCRVQPKLKPPGANPRGKEVHGGKFMLPTQRLLSSTSVVTNSWAKRRGKSQRSERQVRPR